MCTIINIKHSVIALLGDYSKCDCQIKDLQHIINLYIQYGSAIQPIQIQIDKEQWENNNDEYYYIGLLEQHENHAEIYNENKELIPRFKLYNE